MKKIYLSFGFTLLALAFVVQDARAQRYVDVEPGIGTLNDAIAGDTTDTGERVDPENTIYRLQRGTTAYYGLTGSIQNRFPLTIVAEEGDSPRPFLQPVDEGAGSSRAFRPRDHITLRGLHVTNEDDLGGFNTRMLRCSAEGINVFLDDCWFEGDGQALIRCDDPGMNIQVTNSVISRIGLPSSPNNGRGIDDRGNDIDTVIFENCTFYNITSRIIRDGGGKIGYARFNNNTVMNMGQMGITFGSIEEVEVYSNLFVNVGFMPTNDPDRNIFNVDSIQIDETTAEAPEITWHDNLIYFDSTQVQDYMNDTLMMPQLFNETLAAWWDENKGDVPPVGAMLSFEEEPPFADSLIIYDLYPEFDQANAPGWERPDVPAEPEGNGIYHAVVPYDFGYVNSVAYSLGMDEMWGGDNNWEAARDVFATVDFEDEWEELLWSQFANAGDAPENMNVIMNPDPSGVNTSDRVMEFIVLDGADPWAGAYSDAYGNMTFTEEKHHMQVDVWKSIISDVALKVEMGGTATELKVPNTVTNEWETLTFDFSANIGETLTRLVFFPDFTDPRTAGTTAYVDNIKLVTGPNTVDDPESATLKVYPNPASSYLVVEQGNLERVSIVDLLGKQVQDVYPRGKDQVTLNVEELPGGVYFIVVDSGDETVTTKFLKR
ncbi:MAG: T9SS type A sorting domain-containing protein [Bacteroidales bacterium]